MVAQTLTVNKKHEVCIFITAKHSSQQVIDPCAADLVGSYYLNETALPLTAVALLPMISQVQERSGSILIQTWLVYNQVQQAELNDLKAVRLKLATDSNRCEMEGNLDSEWIQTKLCSFGPLDPLVVSSDNLAWWMAQ